VPALSEAADGRVPGPEEEAATVTELQPGDRVSITVVGYFIERDDDVVYIAKTPDDAAHGTGHGFRTELVVSITNLEETP
jgi:hypothetical protein